MHHYTSASKILKRIIKSNPAAHTALHLLGLVMRDEGQTDTAIALMKRAIQYESEEAEYWFTLAVTYYYAFRYTEALPCFQRAVELRPSYKEALGSYFYLKQMV